MNFADFIAPVPVDLFLSDYHGRKPLLIRSEGEAGVRRRNLLSWQRLNELMAILPHWTEANTKLILNSRPVAPEHYVDDVETVGGSMRRASPAKIDVFLGMGASLVANSIEEISPDVREVTAMLGDRFAGRAGANAYCSFKDVQAFQTHCDLHEVFAVHCEGEKGWRIYENRALEPVEQLEGDDAQDMIDRAKGRVVMDVSMRPGDMLYIPRGYYHDALASSQASLHVTMAVAPHTGRILFRLLEDLAMRNPDFRAYLPDARGQDGETLRSRIAQLATKVDALMRTPLFLHAVSERQRALTTPAYVFSLPERPTPDFYARTQSHADVDRRDAGVFLKLSDGEVPLGTLGEPVDWLLAQPAFSTGQLLARYPWQPRAELRALVGLLHRSALFEPYEPELG